ncbi:YciI family protein [Yoonia sp. SS1-5]|uniref:YciI family protein n=1 Tax=Yoonia rhodophyticola TaxID=3137370 RepID=A0AAN0NKZ8_9RHOB
MQFVLMAMDKPGALEVRKANRDAHLAYVADTDVVAFGGPMLDSAGQMCGSLLVLDVPDLAAAQAWADDDPYAKAQLFADVTIRQWKQVIG